MGTNMNTLLIQIVQQIHWYLMQSAFGWNINANNATTAFVISNWQPEHHKMHLLILCCIHDTLLSIFECL
jgi:hypothetical protein